MNAVLKSSAVPTVIGTPWEGGFYAGLISFSGDVYAQVIASKAEGQLSGVHAWGKYGTEIPGAGSFFDGFSNTKAMAEAGLVIAERVLELRIGGFDDWHIAARDQLELAYRGLKPTDDENYVYRNGDKAIELSRFKFLEKTYAGYLGLSASQFSKIKNGRDRAGKVWNLPLTKIAGFQCLVGHTLLTQWIAHQEEMIYSDDLRELHEAEARAAELRAKLLKRVA